MSDDIRLKVSWRNHRKRIKLERLLGKEGVLAWLDLLLATGENKPDGKLTNMTPEDIAIDARWHKNPADLINALVVCRLLDRNDNYYQIHNWEQHNPFVYHAKDRSEKARKAAAVRWGSVQDDAKKDVSKSSTETSNAPSPTPTPTPTLNIPKKERFQIPSPEEIKESSVPKIKEYLQEICDHMYEKEIFTKAHAFKNKMLKENKSERAILHTLIRCYQKKEFNTTPWAYCMKIMQVEDGNYNEYEYRKDKS